MTQNYAFQQYDFAEFSVDEFIGMVKSNKVVLPKFQRDLVWSEKQEIDLAESLKRGIPFGTFLLAGEKPFRLLDGLQRINTIIKIYEHPQSFFEKGQIEHSIIVKIRLVLLENGAIIDQPEENEIANAIVSWVKNQSDTDSTNKFKGMYLAQYMASRFFVSNEKVPSLILKGDEILSPIISQICKEITNIGKIKIPCIIFTGPDELLPTIFEVLNSKGTKLSKYQIFAADWSTHYINNLSSDEVKKSIYLEYSKRQEDSEISIDDVNNEKDFLRKEINLYEYLLGLGKILESKFPFFFDKKGDYIAFLLASACLLGNVRKIIELKDIFSDDFNTQLFQDNLLDSIQIVFRQLKPYIVLKINKSDKLSSKPIIYHSDYQIVSFIAKVFRTKYDAHEVALVKNYEENSEWIKDIPFHYLYDQIEDNWRGSGDSRLEEMLSSDYYLNGISKEKWEKTLHFWFSEKEIIKRQFKRQRIDDIDLLFLNYIYTHLLSIYEVESENCHFHLEHLVPVKKLVDFINEELERKNSNQLIGLPISAISNLCYLDSEINQKKKDKTLYQYMKEIQTRKNVSTIEKKFSFTTESDFSFLEKSEELSRMEWISAYKQFLTNRFDILVEKFITLNKIR